VREGFLWDAFLHARGAYDLAEGARRRRLESRCA
jgi:hypothetical protein